MAEQTEVQGLDYAKLWRTLLRLGIKQRFSQVRAEFFMKIATDGPVKYKGQEDLDKIINNSETFKQSPELVEYLKRAIGPEDEFKHYFYCTDDGVIAIEYFANVSKVFPKEFVDYVASEKNSQPDYDIDGFEYSTTYDVDVRVPASEDEEEDHIVKESHIASLILIAEAAETINPDTYPAIIKHELSHICEYELRLNIHNGYHKSMRLPATWTDEDINTWNEDVASLYQLLNGKDYESHMFKEFVAEFLMYESDGQTKEKNPIKESRVPKATNPNAKPKVTYRTLTPIDRFVEHMDVLDDEYQAYYSKVVSSLREDYEDYDRFLDDVKMA